MADLNIPLSGPMRAWIEARIAAGQFASAGDYVAHLIRLDQEQAKQHADLIEALEKGESSGLSPGWCRKPGTRFGRSWPAGAPKPE